MRKKDLFIAIAIIAITLGIAFYPTLSEMIFQDDISNVEASNTTTLSQTKTTNQITITITGEINAPSLSSETKEVCNTINMNYLPGVTYGEIIRSIRNYLTGYSIIEDDLLKTYYNNSNIIIKSCYKLDEASIHNASAYISINTSPYSELIKLYGIGDKRANKIIEYRESQRIESFEQLKKLIGVSDGVIEAIKEKAVL